MKKRLFISLPVDETYSHLFADYCAKFLRRAGMRCIPPENFHGTVAKYGSL